MMQQQNGNGSAVIIDGDVGLVVILTEENNQTKELACDFIETVAPKR